MSRDFNESASIRTWVAKPVGDRESAVRLYCEQAGSVYALQLRAPLTLANGSTSDKFVIAHGSLDRELLKRLRDAIDSALHEHCEFRDDGCDCEVRS